MPKSISFFSDGVLLGWVTATPAAHQLFFDVSQQRASSGSGIAATGDLLLAVSLAQQQYYICILVENA